MSFTLIWEDFDCQTKKKEELLENVIAQNLKNRNSERRKRNYSNTVTSSNIEVKNASPQIPENVLFNQSVGKELHFPSNKAADTLFLPRL